MNNINGLRVMLLIFFAEVSDVIRPDLLIHSRGNDDHNIMVVEFAAWWQDDKKVNDDKEKLKILTSTGGDYKYRLGALVKIKKDNPDYIYFQNGNER